MEQARGEQLINVAGGCLPALKKIRDFAGHSGTAKAGVDRWGEELRQGGVAWRRGSATPTSVESGGGGGGGGAVAGGK
jgi:hypothetical protein